jgi:hypothetical protein
MTREDAQTFAEEWTAAWNALAVEQVLSHFHDEVRFTSPTAFAVVGIPTVLGKQALRDYWQAATARIGSVRFVIDRVAWDPDSRELAIIYDAELGGRGRRVSEHLRFGPDGLVISGEVFRGVETERR